MTTSYHTIKHEGEGTYKEKGSKFLAFSFPVKNEEEIRKKTTDLKKKFYDARHHCYAYILGTRGEIFRTNDDGEPSHSAGDPILAAIRSRKITNALVVVVRYFGGTKLGVGGLIQAYRTSAEQALDSAGIIREDILQEFTVTFSYANTGEVMSLVNRVGATILEQEFKEECQLKLEIKLDAADGLREKLHEMKSQKIIHSFEVAP